MLTSYQVYVCNKCHVTSVYIFRFVPNFTNMIIAFVSRYGANEISECFTQDVQHEP